MWPDINKNDFEDKHSDREPLHKPIWNRDNTERSPEGNRQGESMEKYSPKSAFNNSESNYIAGDGPKPVYHPVPGKYKKSGLPGFKNSRPLKGKNGARPSWDLGKGKWAEWDFENGEVEVYNKIKNIKDNIIQKQGNKLSPVRKNDNQHIINTIYPYYQCL